MGPHERSNKDTEGEATWRRKRLDEVYEQYVGRSLLEAKKKALEAGVGRSLLEDGCMNCEKRQDNKSKGVVEHPSDERKEGMHMLEKSEVRSQGLAAKGKNLGSEIGVVASHTVDVGITADIHKVKKAKEVLDDDSGKGIEGIECMEHSKGQTNMLAGEGVSETPPSHKEVIYLSSDSDGSESDDNEVRVVDLGSLRRTFVWRRKISS